MLARRWPIAAFAVWSAYVWVTRIANAWSATSDESTSAKVISTATAVLLLAGAAAAAAILVRARGRAFQAGETLVLRLVAGATVAVWLVRVPLILADGAHDVPFKVVHATLGVVSVVLAGLTWWRSGDAGTPADLAAGSDLRRDAVSPAATPGR